MDKLGAGTALLINRKGGISQCNGLKIALAALAISLPSTLCEATSIRKQKYDHKKSGD